jgi:hypothetical protein
MTPDPSRLGLIVTRSEALDAGLTRDQIRQRLRSGRWRRLDTGVYLRDTARRTDLDEFADARVAHVERCVAAVRRHHGCSIGFGSAALTLGLPLATGVPELGQLIVPPGGWTGIRDGVRYRSATLPAEDVAGAGVQVTSPARTVVDIARTHPLADALAVGDAAVRSGGTTVDEVRAVLRRMGTVRGCRRAVEALAHLGGRRETVLESLSWARFLEWGLPLPELQHEFWDDDGFVGRVDFWWPRFRLVGEADGRLKYATGDDLYAEKYREDRLRALDLGMLRWGWPDLWGTPAERLRRRLVARLR